MSYARIAPDDARILIDDRQAVVVDIRDAESFAASRIENAQHLDDTSVAAFISNADSAVPVIVCCYHGHSSQGAGAMLASRGFDEVYSLDGGFTDWAIRFPDDIEGTGVT